MLKQRLAFLLLGFLILQSGCSFFEDNEKRFSKESNQKPPRLTITVGNESFAAIVGSSSWSYSNGNGTAVEESADAPPPPELVKLQTPVEVNPNTEVILQFEKEPLSYEVKIWDPASEEVISTSDTFRLPSYSGEFVYEVLAEWGQGKVSYAFSLNLN